MLRRSAPALGLLLLAPVCADTSLWLRRVDREPERAAVGPADPRPLYGGAALLSREAARRSGRAWTTMLLGLAFGVAQAA